MRTKARRARARRKLILRAVEYVHVHHCSPAKAYFDIQFAGRPTARVWRFRRPAPWESILVRQLVAERHRRGWQSPVITNVSRRWVSGRNVQGLPRLQNIPLRTPFGRKIREVLEERFEPELLLMGLDWGDLERRMAAISESPFNRRK